MQSQVQVQVREQVQEQVQEQVREQVQEQVQVREQVQEQEQVPHSAPYQVNRRRRSPLVRTLPLQVFRLIPDPLSSTVKKNSHNHEVI